MKNPLKCAAMQAKLSAFVAAVAKRHDLATIIKLARGPRFVVMTLRYDNGEIRELTFLVIKANNITLVLDGIEQVDVEGAAAAALLRK